MKLHNPGPAVLLPDVNGDGYGDLLFPGRLIPVQADTLSQEYSSAETKIPETDLSPHSNELVLVCGQSGSILGSPFVLKQCQKIISTVVNDKDLSYTCLTFINEGEYYQGYLDFLLS